MHIPWVMGLIGTRSLTTEIPGIDELVEQRREPHPRAASSPTTRCSISAQPAAPAPSRRRCADAFERIGRDLGYALLLKRYVDDPRQATR